MPYKSLRGVRAPNRNSSDDSGRIGDLLTYTGEVKWKTVVEIKMCDLMKKCGGDGNLWLNAKIEWKWKAVVGWKAVVEIETCS